MTKLNLKKKDFEFMKILNNNEMPLGMIGSKMGIEKYEIQRIFNNLVKSGMIISRKEGRKRLVKLIKNGKYLNDWYQRSKIGIGTNKKK